MAKLEEQQKVQSQPTQSEGASNSHPAQAAADVNAALNSLEGLDQAKHANDGQKRPLRPQDGLNIAKSSGNIAEAGRSIIGSRSVGLAAPGEGSSMSLSSFRRYSELVSHMESQATGGVGGKFAVDGLAEPAGDLTIAVSIVTCALIEMVSRNSNSKSGDSHVDYTWRLQAAISGASSERNRQFGELRSSILLEQMRCKSGRATRPLTPACMRDLLALLRRIERLLIQLAMSPDGRRNMGTLTAIQRMLFALRRAESFLIRRLN